MISVHYSWFIFLPIVLVLFYLIAKGDDDSSNAYYSFDLITPFWILILILFIAFFGGIFWW